MFRTTPVVGPRYLQWQILLCTVKKIVVDNLVICGSLIVSWDPEPPLVLWKNILVRFSWILWFLLFVHCYNQWFICSEPTFKSSRRHSNNIVRFLTIEQCKRCKIYWWKLLKSFYKLFSLKTVCNRKATSKCFKTHTGICLREQRLCYFSQWKEFDKLALTRWNGNSIRAPICS